MKRIALILALLLGFVHPANAAIALLTHTAAASSSGNAVTTSAIDTTGANLIVVGVSSFSGAAATAITDSKSETWHQLTSYAPGSATRVTIYWTNPSTVGSGHTFTSTLSGGFMSIMVAAFSGANTSSPVDQQSGSASQDNGGGGGKTNPGSVTPGQANELLITIESDQFGTALGSVDSSFTALDRVNYVGGAAFGGCMAYLIETTATAKNPNWIITGGSNAVSSIATFKVAAVAGNPVVAPLIDDF